MFKVSPWRHRWRHQDQNNFFGDNFWRSFHIWCQNEPILNISKISKWPPYWGPGELLNRRCTENWVLHHDRPCHSLHFDILFDVLAHILTELWLFQNLTYLWTWWRHRWRHQHQKVYTDSQIQDTYMCQVWCWLLERCDQYREYYRQTNKQTDRQTDRQTVRRTYLSKLKILASNNK